ncbi:DUF481 domain-containing protein [Ekhidna sp.]|uniref:DUF481 domain-containing protein n=1 Tax=Ekhidna sp. TaxID=2608089 RepID=UPI003B50B26A
MKKILFLFLLLPFLAQSQILFSESFVVIFDSTKHFKGSVAPSLEIKTQKQLYVEITNRADMAFRFKNHGITVANKFELTRDGSETILSGGFIYGKFKTFYDNPFVLEHYAQHQWAEARGLDRKIAIGSNVRYKLLKTQKGGAFAGIGPFYEYELWNYRGVPDDRLPLNTTSISMREWKLNVYLSTKRELSEKIRFEGSVYFQDGFNDLFSEPRWAGAIAFSYSFTKNIAFGVNLQTIYDFNPIVPVDKLWLNTFSALEVTF